MTLLLVAVVAAAPLVKPGEITDPIACAEEPKFSYALYLPASYTPDRLWPTLYIFDPGARGGSRRSCSATPRSAAASSW